MELSKLYSSVLKMIKLFRVYIGIIPTNSEDGSRFVRFISQNRIYNVFMEGFYINECIN